MNRRELVQSIAADPDGDWTAEQRAEVWAELEHFWGLSDSPERLPKAIQAHLRCHSVPTRPELETWLQWASMASETERKEAAPSGSEVVEEIRGKAEEMRLAGSIPFARILEGWADRIEEGEPKPPAAIAGTEARCYECNTPMEHRWCCPGCNSTQVLPEIQHSAAIAGVVEDIKRVIRCAKPEHETAIVLKEMLYGWISLLRATLGQGNRYEPVCYCGTLMKDHRGGESGCNTPHELLPPEEHDKPPPKSAERDKHIHKRWGPLLSRLTDDQPAPETADDPYSGLCSVCREEYGARKMSALVTGAHTNVPESCDCLEVQAADETPDPTDALEQRERPSTITPEEVRAAVDRPTDPTLRENLDRTFRTSPPNVRLRGDAPAPEPADGEQCNGCDTGPCDTEAMGTCTEAHEDAGIKHPYVGPADGGLYPCAACDSTGWYESEDRPCTCEWGRKLARERNSALADGELPGCQKAKKLAAPMRARLEDGNRPRMADAWRAVFYLESLPRRTAAVVDTCSQCGVECTPTYRECPDCRQKMGEAEVRLAAQIRSRTDAVGEVERELRERAPHWASFTTPGSLGNWLIALADKLAGSATGLCDICQQAPRRATCMCAECEDKLTEANRRLEPHPDAGGMLKRLVELESVDTGDACDQDEAKCEAIEIARNVLSQLNRRLDAWESACDTCAKVGPLASEIGERKTWQERATKAEQRGRRIQPAPAKVWLVMHSAVDPRNVAVHSSPIDPPGGARTEGRVRNARCLKQRRAERDAGKS